MAFVLIGSAGVLAKDRTPGETECPESMPPSDCEAIASREVLDAARKPWSAIGQIARLRIDAKAHCSGVLVADDVVLTAAHCLWDGAAGKWFDPGEVEFIAGYQNGNWVARSVASRIVVHPDFAKSGTAYKHDPARDRAMLVLEQPIGKEAGHLAVHPLSFLELVEDELPGSINAIAGYPRIRSGTLTMDRSCRIIAKRPVGQNWVIYHTCPMVTGDSGSPLLRIVDGEPHVIGINSAVERSNGQLIGIAAAETGRPE